MREFHVREFFETPRDQWRCQYNERFALVFDDGDRLETTTARTEVSRKLWLPHENFDRLKLLKRHHIGAGPLSNSRIQDVLSAVAEDVDTVYGATNYDREFLWRLIYYSFNRLYNESVVEYSEYVRSIGSFDFHELYVHPPIKEAREAICPNALSIDKGNKVIEKILLTDPTIRLNPIVSDLRAGLVKMEQLLQVLVVRGFNTDIDSHIYPVPIMGNYYAGIHDPAEMMMESTLAAKAILFQGQPLEQTEYANRKMQFTAQQVDLLVMGDCGSTYLADIMVTKNRFRDMEGLYFHDPVSRTLRPLRSTDTDLIGHTFGFRLAFNCHYRHKNSVCATCYGLLHKNVPYGANIGHIASTMTMSEVSQQVLKVKHSEASTVTEAVNISREERDYILPGDKPNQIKLNPDLKEKGIRLLLRSTPTQQSFNASKLPILKRSDLQEGLSMAKHSQFRRVTFDHPTQGKQLKRYHISVSRGAKMSHLTAEFLRYFLDQRFSIRDDGHYHIDLSEWDFSKPVFELPNKHTSMKDFAAEVETFIRSTSDDSQRHLGPLRQLRQYDDPVEALLDGHELISSRVSVHFTHLSIVLLSMMVPRDSVVDMRIPPAGVPTRFAKYDHIMNGRSLGPLFAYQGGKKALMDIQQFMNTERDSHLLDPLLLPM